jgi:hypothetical protein
MSFLKFGSPKRKTHKFLRIMSHLKLSKNMFWNKEIEKQTKFVTHLDL